VTLDKGGHLPGQKIIPGPAFPRLPWFCLLLGFGVFLSKVLVSDGWGGVVLFGAGGACVWGHIPKEGQLCSENLKVVGGVVLLALR